MKKLLLLIVAISFIPIVLNSQTNQKDFPVLKGPYLGQKPPGITPELFAPEIMNAELGYHSTIVFSPDMTEAFWSPMEIVSIMMHSKTINGIWSPPEKVNFGLKMGAREPAFSSNGKRLYFQSFQPPKPGDTEQERIWFVDRINEGWSEPKLIDKVILKHPSYWTFSFAANGNLYFTSGKSSVRGERDIYLARFDGNKYLDPMNLGEMINSDGKDLAPCVAPDESYIVFTRVGKNTRKADLYVSFKKNDGSWTKAIEMGSEINTIYNNLCASLSPDGKYLFYLSQRDGWNRMFWVSTKVIEKLSPP